MSTRINLLPWRDEQHKQKQVEFIVICAGAFLSMAIVIGGVYLFFENQINYQTERNEYLQAEIRKLDEKIKKIRELEKEKANLLARMQIIEQLQSSRPQVVHVFDELVDTLPDGVYLEKVRNNGKNITIEGLAQSNARVSTYMRNIEKSLWLTKPDLTIIETKEQKQDKDKNKEGARKQRISRFILHATQNDPNKKPEEEDDGSQS
ncbi:MAG: hypothetical protein BMS9Abin26_0329 [Gammaproteobacteria bacterium]|nr:MAG: hypothetical protein BMS9Abin26_0329 [Gammaproteobacteria bacterium]